MASGLVKACWVAPFEAVLPDGTVLVPNETVVEIGADEANDSEHWKPKGKPAPLTKDQLAAQASELGVDVASNATKAEIEKAIAQATRSDS